MHLHDQELSGINCCNEWFKLMFCVLITMIVYYKITCGIDLSIDEYILDTVLEPIKFNFDLNVMHNSKTKRVISTIHLVHAATSKPLHDKVQDHISKNYLLYGAMFGVATILGSFLCSQIKETEVKLKSDVSEIKTMLTPFIVKVKMNKERLDDIKKDLHRR
ncbi:hypothetical protein BATDEDRAFT_21943 [Batrachochytrium dendrobatidis JAM81]|uniref:Uncharacterized protein n=1 Tax=Batrachochytrium dendrobatidis (strain JAM81 / FGSC 10211) TaxID=684364 RepID=F4NRG9_BATDJ|nr:uncharacterized protein BATDEDRAFT_21943 [Batrachochytrium dendrobatidis JAM81]EGF83338.1 hypothetical protein BATDEDRAFT_21943 [Batrachochytrium dendrobatidis JAM81]|eukprot:XP_006675424.1 hypothetical protein BATDEDRAFT_21943 [Batrachochytrium dendrobatidis JAM81]